jgi:hypothetical protein
MPITGKSRLFQLFARAPGRDEVEATGDQGRGEIDESGLVGHADQSAGHLGCRNLRGGDAEAWEYCGHRVERDVVPAAARLTHT